MNATVNKSPFTAMKAAASKKSGYVVEVPPTIWVAGRPNVPTTAVKLGLKIVSESEVARARSAAESFANKNHRDLASEEVWLEAFNSHLIATILFDAVVYPDNIERRWFQRDSQVAQDLTTSGLQLLWDHYEIYQIRTSTIAPEATDEQLMVMAEALLAGDLFDGMELERARRMRRLLKAAMMEVA
jgi:hypothetical protein